MFNLQRKNLIVVLSLLLVALVVAACSPAPAQPAAAQVETPGGGITVVGEGEATGEPDEASVVIGVETFAETVAEATSANESNVQSIMSALESIGIEAADIQTSNYSLWAEQRYGDNGPEGIVGYRVTNQVNVTIRDIDQVGAVIGAVTEAGANSIHGVTFSVADPAALEAEARAAAIANAREKAASLAELSGVELGDIVSVTEVIGQPGIPLAGGYGGGRDMAEQSAAPGISPGELSYGVQVQVTFAIR
jgi:uncharacterized protein YggE